MDPRHPLMLTGVSRHQLEDPFIQKDSPVPASNFGTIVVSQEVLAIKKQLNMM
jgi:hypothetical protein